MEYKKIAQSSFDFLLLKTFSNNTIKVISNKSWLNKGREHDVAAKGGEQPIDVAYTILALRKFYDVFCDQKYSNKIESAFSWFLGNNHRTRLFTIHVPGVAMMAWRKII